MTKRIFFFCLLFFCFAASSFAQYKPEWIDKIKETIQQKETSWKIDSQNGHGEKETWTQNFFLKSGKQTASIEITFLNATNFEESFEDSSNSVSKTIGKGMQKKKLQNIGDGGYIWTTADGGGSTMIQAKKRKFIVIIYAPNEPTARRWAKYVFDQIPNTEVN